MTEPYQLPKRKRIPYGMMNFVDVREDNCYFVDIPNQVVREQMYGYLLETYRENDLRYDSYRMGNLESDLAYDGSWQDYFGYIAECIKTFSSQRDKQKGEYYVHGFTLALTSQNCYYRPVSELDNQEGYADIFMLPLLDIYKDMKHSYIIELKYAKSSDSAERVEELRQKGIVQANRYAATEMVKRYIGHTQLHKIVVVFHGVDMAVCEEIGA